MLATSPDVARPLRGRTSSLGMLPHMQKEMERSKTQRKREAIARSIRTEVSGNEMYDPTIFRLVRALFD
jgi:hypothetical protein